MNDCKNESKCLASLAVFRGLYNSKNDVYGVISEFLKEVIISQSKHQFSLTEITRLLNNTFDFHLPDAIVQTAIKRIDFIEKQQGIYVSTNLVNQKRPEIYESQEQQQIKNNIIIEQLFSYIQDVQNIELSEEQKEKIVNSFCSFLLEDSNGHEYSEFISAFIISKSKDIEFTNQLNYIKEGVVLYSGLKYNSNINELGSWTTPLTIYIETEVLFHLAGYNGEVYQSLFNDFYAFVKEINTKSGKKLIQLKYFQEVKNEIERFFKKAEYIIEGRDRINPSNTAMRSILDGCDSPADIVLKKASFYELLRVTGIREDDYLDYFAEKNYKYNIIDQATLDKVSEELQVDDINETLRFLNFINIHRREESANNFENIKFILLSGNSTTLKVAWHNDIKEQGNVPLATNLSFITNKFWFKLNKGFGKSDYPKTFDIITKAQIILSTQLNESVRAKYEEYKVKNKKGELTEAQAVATIAALRSQARNPENIIEDDISNILDSISEDKIEKYLEEHEHLKNKVIKEVEDNIKLKQYLSNKEDEIKERDKLYQQEQELKRQKEAELLKNIIESKRQLLLEKKKNKESLERQKYPIDNQALQQFRNFKLLVAACFIGYYILTYYLIWKFSWNLMEQMTYIINGTLPIIMSFLYILIFERTFSPAKYLEKKKAGIYANKYNQFNFDLNRLTELDREIEELNNELNKTK